MALLRCECSTVFSMDSIIPTVALFSMYVLYCTISHFLCKVMYNCHCFQCKVLYQQLHCFPCTLLYNCIVFVLCTGFYKCTVVDIHCFLCVGIDDPEELKYTILIFCLWLPIVMEILTNLSTSSSI